MEFEDFYQRFGGSFRTKMFGKNWNGQYRKHPSSKSELSSDFIALCPWEAEYLWTCVQGFTGTIVEIGRRNGGSTFLFACAAPKATIHSIDIAPTNDDYLRGVFKLYGVGDNVTLLKGDSQKHVWGEIRLVGFAFIDGDHSVEGAWNDLKEWWPKIIPGGHMVCHDSYRGSPCALSYKGFVDTHHDVEAVVSPIKLRDHSLYPEGSLCHFRRPYGVRR